MKKKVWLFVLACICCIAFAVAGCAGCADKAENISLSITNKEALTAEWLEEGENRTVELSITPEKYTVNNSEVVVTSDNSEVVKADGLTLLATGGGTANITVSLGKASDTVAITVTPKLRGVSITNKAELSEVWGLGDTDRTLDVAKLFKNSTAPLTASDVTVTSSAPEIIEADGFALKTKAIGDAEITVAYGDFTDKVSLSVVSALETFGITNKEELANLALGTTYDLSSYVTFSPLLYTAENTRPVITCEPAGIIEQVEGYQIKAASNGSATVTVTVRGKSDTFSVSVELGTPKITFDVDEVGARFEETYEGGILSVLQTGYYNGETDVVLPTVYARTSDGNYINDIVIKKGEDVITENTVKLTKGTYQLTYSAADPRDNSKVATKTLTVNVYRNVMAAGDANGFTLTEETRYSADENQVLKNNGNGYVTARLNMEPGKVYYMEATFVLSAYNSNPNYGGSPVLGMAHYLGNGNGRRLSLVIGRASGNVFIRVANAGDNYYDNPIRQITNIKDAFSLIAPEGYVFPKDESAEAGKKVKIAIARDGDYFYLFMNDQLIDMRTVSGFEDDTVPAITGDRLSETTMENIVMLDGDAARNKINTFNTPGVEITNKDSLKAVWTNKYAKRTVEAQITDLQTPCQDVVKFTVTSDNSDVISVYEDGVTLKAHKNGEATIKVSVGNKFDTVKIKVELPAIPAGTPVIEFIRPEDENVKFQETEQGATLGVVQTGYNDENTTVTLPTVIAMLDDTDISDRLTVTLDGASTTLVGNTVTLSKGTHTLTYTVTNTQNGVSVTKTLTVNVYRKIFSYKGPYQDSNPEWDYMVSKEYVDDEEQIVKVGSQYVSRSIFNMVPSKLYYAEVTFVLPAYLSSNFDTDPIMGLGHFVGDENLRRLSCVVGRKSGNIFVTDYKSGNIWDDPIGGSYNVNTKTSLTEKDGCVFPANTSDTKGLKVKIAIARSGSVYYLFINDVLMEARDMTGIADGYYLDESIPGISGDRLINCDMINVKFFGGSGAQDKIDGLLPTPEITNKSAFADKIDQTFTGKVEVTVTPNYYNNDDKLKCLFKSSNESAVAVGEDGTITAIANGEATITVTIGSKSDSVTVTVELKADTPVLTLTAPADGNVEYTVTEDGATLGVVQTGYCNEDTTVTLPTVTAKLGDTDISDSITVTIDGASTTLTGNTVALSKGAHTVTYTATNADNANSVTKTLTINVYRKIFSYKGPNQDAHPEWDCIVSKEYAPDSEQEVTTTGTSVLRGVFNMTPSTLYYAEVTFVLPAYDDDQGNPIIGLGHYVGEEKARRLSYVVGRGTGSVFVADFTAGNGSIWDDPIGGKYNINTKTSLTEKDGYIFLKDTSTTAGKKVKLAIARSGNIYYLFMNDVLIEERDISGIDNGYYSAASVPGISADRMSKTTITDIRLLDAADATNKINGLLPKLTVSNQSELEKVWTEDGTRTVDYSVSGDILGAVTVTSSDPTVVSVDGTTLTAHKFGTANITVALAGGNTVNFTVTVQSKETGFEIANKTTVEAVWTYKENDEENNSRTLDVKAIFDRGGAKQTVPAGQLEVTSSDPQSVAVGGLTLTALKVSSSPVTITVKYKDFAAQTVTVNITDVVLESISLSKLMQGDSEITAQDEVYTVEAGKVYVVELAYNPADKFNADNTEAVIACADDGVIEEVVGAKNTFKAVGFGEHTITVTVNGKTAQFKINVTRTAPEMTVTAPASGEFRGNEDGSYTLNTVQSDCYNEDSVIALPSVNASDCVGGTLTVDITAKDADGTDVTVTDGKITVATGMGYTVKFKATDPQDTSKFTEKTLIVNVYRKIFSYKGPGEPQGHPEWECVVSKEYETDDKQEVTVMRTDTYRSVFNMAPSTLYYAEVTFILPAYNGSEQSSPIIGLGHFVGNETRRRLSCVVGRNTGNIFVTDYQSGSVWDDPIGGRYNVSDKTSLKEKDGYVFPKDESAEAGKKVKIAIARDGNKFYLFMNDVLIEVRDVTGVADGYYSDASIPGISGDKLSQTTLTNIVFLDGDAVRNEIAKRLPTPNITNKSAFAEKIDQTFTGKVEVSFTPEYYNGNTKVTFKSSDESVVKVGEDGTITAIANGEATITVTIGSKSDSVTVTVELKADTPVLTLTAPADGNVEYTVTEDGATLGVVQTGYCNEDTTVTLPTVTAKLGDTDISDSITVTIDGASTTLTGNTVALSKGAHTIIYTVTNSEDSTKSAKMTLTINVARKVMKDDSSFKVTDETRYLSNDKQVVTVAKNVDVLGGAFNMAPSKLYYAEATFEFKEAGGVILGFGHFIENDTNRWLSCCVSKTTGNVVVKDHQSGNIYDNLLQSNTVIDRTQFTAEEGYTFLGIDQSTKDVKVKIAIARNENKFYLFINDVLLEERDMTGVVDGHYLEASVPGISGQYLNHVNITNIDFFGGEDATSKLAGLIPTPTINNKTAFSNPIDQTFEGKVEVSITPDRYNGKIKVTYTSDNESAVTVGADGTVTPKANGEATITVAIGDKTDTVKITVELKADTPVLTLTPPATAENVKYTATEAGATLDVVQTGRYNENTTVTLPQFSAILGEADISGDVSVTLDGKSTTPTGNTVTLANGTHTIIYTATNPENNKSATKTLTINVYRKIFSYKGPNQDAHPEWDCVVSKENAADSAQEVTTTSTSRLRGVFNMAPSTLYYAEVTFILSAHDGDQGNPIIGLGHYVAKDNANNARRLSCVVGRASGTIFVADFTEGNGNIWDNPIGGSYNISTKTSLKEKDGYVFPANTSGTAGAKVKYAVARSGNTYYLFINDVLMEARDMTNVASGYYLNESVPGISGDRLSKTTITNIVFMDGSEATEKINALTQTTQGDSETQNAAPAEQAVIPKKEEE